DLDHVVVALVATLTPCTVTAMTSGGVWHWRTAARVAAPTGSRIVSSMSPPAPAHQVRGTPVGGIRHDDRVGRPGHGGPALGRLLPRPAGYPAHLPRRPRRSPRAHHQLTGRVRRGDRPRGHPGPP